MKLNFAENLRKLRHDKNMTQEQLAEKLCTTFQSVSRWENGATYPDIELLPVIANLFETTVDDLLGGEKAHDGRAPWEYYDKFSSISDQNEAIEFLREVHRDFPNDNDMLSRLCTYLAQCCTGDEDSLEELRRLSEELLERCIPIHLREHVITAMIRAETDEDRMQEFLQKYATIFDMRKINLLEQRYKQLQDWDNYEVAKQTIAVKGLLEDTLIRMRWFVGDFPDNIDINREFWMTETSLEIINLLTETSGGSIVSGDGVPDLWYQSRFYAGVRYASYLASMGETEKALTAVEDLTDLFEAFWSLPEGTEMTFRSPAFDRLKEPLDISHRITSAGNKKSVLVYNKHDNGIYLFGCTYDDLNQLTSNKHGLDLLDPIRQHPRYIACVERMKKYDITEE